MFTTIGPFTYNMLGDTMKIIKMDQEKVIIFLPSPIFSVDLCEKDQLEDYFRALFLKLEEYYDMNMRGFYQIRVYQDSNYGAVFEIDEEDVPYFNYLDQQVEMSIQIIKGSFFLYQVEDILELDQDIIKSCTFYQYQNHFFLKLNEKISLGNYIKLLEHSEIIYGSKTKRITRLGKLFQFTLCQ